MWDLTEADTGILLTDILTLLIGKEHVGREATLGRVRICGRKSARLDGSYVHADDIPFFFFSTLALGVRLGLVSLGIVTVMRL